MAERTREQAEAARIQAVRASELPALREAEARAAAGLQRLTNARETLDREEARAQERVAELDRRLTQFSADIAREQQQTADADAALLRLDTEDAELKEEIKSRVEKRSGVDERVSEAETTLTAAERLFAELTTALADLTAKRNQLEGNVRTHRDRLARLDQEIANVERDEQKLAQETSALGDLAALAAVMEAGAAASCGQRKPRPRRSEAGHAAARAKLEAARAPLNEADKRVQRLETEARTISKLVNGETKNLWPPIIDGVTVAKGYEKALGAALGDDLDAPVDPSAPMRWTNADVDRGRSCVARGRRSARRPCRRRRPNWRGVWRRSASSRSERGAELVSQLKTGQRLVSLEGDVWRWDGFVAAAHAPTGAARRLAERARLVDIENELEQARIDAAAKRQALETAEAELKAASAAENLGTRGLARRPARDRRRARASCCDRARNQPSRRAQVGADRSPHPPCRRPQPRRKARTRARPRRWRNCRRACATETKFAAVKTDIDGHAAHCSPGARRSAGAGARG